MKRLRSPYNRAFERKEILTQATTQMNIADGMLSEISQMPKDEAYMIHMEEVPRRGKLIDVEQKIEVPRAPWWGAGHREFDGDRVSVWEDAMFLEMDSGDGCRTW